MPGSQWVGNGTLKHKLVFTFKVHLNKRPKASPTQGESAATDLMAGNRTFEKKKNFASPDLARAVAGGPRPMGAGGGRSFIRRRGGVRVGLRRVGPESGEGCL